MLATGPTFSAKILTANSIRADSSFLMVKEIRIPVNTPEEPVRASQPCCLAARRHSECTTSRLDAIYPSNNFYCLPFPTTVAESFLNDTEVLAQYERRVARRARIEKSKHTSLTGFQHFVSFSI